MIISEFGKHSLGESLLLRALVYRREFFTVNWPLGVSMLSPSPEIRLIDDPLAWLLGERGWRNLVLFIFIWVNNLWINSLIYCMWIIQFLFSSLPRSLPLYRPWFYCQPLSSPTCTGPCKALRATWSRTFSRLALSSCVGIHQFSWLTLLLKKIVDLNAPLDDISKWLSYRIFLLSATLMSKYRQHPFESQIDDSSLALRLYIKTWHHDWL